MESRYSDSEQWALDSGSCVRKYVGVQVPPRAQPDQQRCGSAIATCGMAGCSANMLTNETAPAEAGARSRPGPSRRAAQRGMPIWSCDMARQGRRAGFIREKRPGLWEISAEGAPGPDGRRRRKWQTVRGGRRDAERALAILIADLADGRVDPGAGTFTELLEDWWSTKRAARWEDATAIRHRQDIDTHLSPALGRRPVDSLRPADFTRLYARMTAVGCAPRTVQHVHGTARAAIKFGIALG